ncbi:MAG: UDP-N-acetylmuramoyl-L-alanine--D-glutamate ligase [Phycisphaerales bacterium]|nr:UDP-N-acetylmuramoyl-L-alanine--D-glutamate ligase [Phycisphaerales bacterium]
MKSVPVQHQEWNGLRVYVMGLGRFGGGVGVARYLAENGAHVVVGDSGSRESLSDSIQALQEHIDSGRTRCVFGPHAFQDLEGIDVLVVNPAIPMPWTNAFILRAESLGIRVTTEIEISARLVNPDRVIGVTGSAGKSTTSAMIEFGLNRLGVHAMLTGNFGGSLLSRLSELETESVVVLELSSAMLYWLERSGYFEDHTFRVGCLTNCVPNHLDWHGDEEHYIQSKKILLKGARHRVVGPDLAAWVSGTVQLVTVSDAVKDCIVPGSHNALNAGMAALAVEHVYQGDRQSIESAVRDFQGLPHRLQCVGSYGGIEYFNDSKCTVPDATLLAIDALASNRKENTIHVIVGGYDKGSDLACISQRAPELAGLYCIGATGLSIAQGAPSKAHYCDDLENALRVIHKNSKPGDTVLLSPGCASWDQFSSFEQRGERFMQLAQHGSGELI